MSHLSGKKFYYKYTVMRTEKDKDKFTWEHYYRESYTQPTTGPGVNRLLVIQEKWKNTGITRNVIFSTMTQVYR